MPKYRARIRSGMFRFNIGTPTGRRLNLSRQWTEITQQQRDDLIAAIEARLLPLALQDVQIEEIQPACQPALHL